MISSLQWPTYSLHVLKKDSSPLSDVSSKNSTKPQKNETVDLATLYIVEGDYEGRFQRGQDGRFGVMSRIPLLEARVRDSQIRSPRH